MMSATREQAESFKSYMASAFNCRIVTRKDSFEFQLIHQLLSLWGASDVVAELLKDRSFTVWRLVYLADDLSPDETIEHITHECQHVVQQGREGWTIAAQYLLTGEGRARIEAEAYRAGAELTYARTKVVPTPDQLTDPMRHGYLLSDDDLHLAKKLLEIAMTTLSQMIYSTESARKAIKFIEGTFPELLAS